MPHQSAPIAAVPRALRAMPAETGGDSSDDDDGYATAEEYRSLDAAALKELAELDAAPLTWADWRACVRGLFSPWTTAATTMPPAELRAAVLAFGNHAGLLYALMAGVATTGVFLAATTAAGTTTHPLAHLAVCDSMVAAAGRVVGMELDLLALSQLLKTPLFISSVFWCLHGLLGSMQCIARVSSVPEHRVPQFMRENPHALHSTGWFLIPGVATLGAGIVCATHELHGEPVTTFAGVGLLSLGLYAFYGVFKLGFSTERINLLERRRREWWRQWRLQQQKQLQQQRESRRKAPEAGGAAGGGSDAAVVGATTPAAAAAAARATADAQQPPP